MMCEYCDNQVNDAAMNADPLGREVCDPCRVELDLIEAESLERARAAELVHEEEVVTAFRIREEEVVAAVRNAFGILSGCAPDCSVEVFDAHATGVALLSGAPTDDVALAIAVCDPAAYAHAICYVDQHPYPSRDATWPRACSYCGQAADCYACVDMRASDTVADAINKQSVLRCADCCDLVPPDRLAYLLVFDHSGSIL